MRSRSTTSRSFKVPELVLSAAEQMGAALRQRLIPHPGELGTGREEIIREFLRQYLPKRFGVLTGFVFDSCGGVSRQLDVIIYDNLMSPRFEAIGGKYFVPCESVVCVGEIKSSLTSKRTIKKALDTLLSAKRLDRSAGGRNFALINDEPINQEENHLDQIFTFLFIADKCVSEEIMRKTLFEYICEYDRHLWPNICYYFEHYLLTYGCESGFCPNPMDAFAISSLNSESGENLLLTFCRLVAGAIYVTRVSSFSYWEYLTGPDKPQAPMYAFSDAPIKGPLPDHLSNVPSSGSFRRSPAE